MKALFELSEGRNIEIWEYGNPEFGRKNVRFINNRRLGIVPALLNTGFRARIVESAHFHLEYPNAVLLPIWLFFKLFLRFKWIKIIHDGSLPSRYSEFSLVQRMLFRLAVRSVTEFIVVNKSLEDWLRNTVKVKQSIVHIPSLLPIPENGYTGEIPEEFKEVLEQYQRHKRRVCSIGAFIPSYGFKDVAEAVESIRNDSGEDIGLLLIDAMFAGDNEYREEIVNGREWITVIAEVPHSAICSILQISDLFVRSVQRESYGISRVEALWSGIPVVATNVGETRGMRVFEFGDMSQLIRQIRESIDNPLSVEERIFAGMFHLESLENFDRYLRVIEGSMDYLAGPSRIYKSPEGHGASGAPA